MSRMHRYVRKVVLPLVVGAVALLAITATVAGGEYVDGERASATVTVVASDTHWT